MPSVEEYHSARPSFIIDNQRWVSRHRGITEMLHTNEIFAPDSLRVGRYEVSGVGKTLHSSCVFCEYYLRLKAHMRVMRQKLMEILACPVCRFHPLELTVTKQEGDEIIEGKIRCPKCSIDYAIEDSIPNMLPPDLR